MFPVLNFGSSAAANFFAGGEDLGYFAY